MKLIVPLILAATTLTACGGSDGSHHSVQNPNIADGSTDTGTGDTGGTDTGSGDTGSTDTGSSNTGSGDTGTGDTGGTDTGSGDTGGTDTGSGDTGSTDTGTGDTGSTDTGSSNTGSGDTGTGNTGSGGATNAAITLNNNVIDVTESKSTVITLGAATNANNDVITYTISPMTHVTAGPGTNQITYSNAVLETEILSVQADDGVNPAVTATLKVNVLAPATSSYVTTTEIISPTLGASMPAKGESRTDPVTGLKITRITDANDLIGTNNTMLSYSRYSPENSDGKYILVFGDSTSTSWVIDRHTGTVINKLSGHTGATIGEYHEVRWDGTGNHPNRVYYRWQNSLYKIDDVTANTPTAELIKDFSSLVPAAEIIYNEAEGDSSNDSDHWAFMAAHYDGSQYQVDAFIHYQVSTDTTHILRPADLAGTNLDMEKDNEVFGFYRPDMVEVSPLGTGLVIHTDYKFDDSSYGGNAATYIGTWADGAWLWPMDFDVNRQPPVKISVSASPSGWAFANDGREIFISENTRNDYLDATYVNGDSAGYGNRIRVANNANIGYTVGFHYGKMPPSKKGWLFMGTYANESTSSEAGVKWGLNQLAMIQVKPAGESPVIWRLGHNYNAYLGNYLDKAQAAINYQGNRIYLTANWGDVNNPREIYMIELPNDWTEAPELQ